MTFNKQALIDQTQKNGLRAECWFNTPSQKLFIQ